YGWIARKTLANALGVTDRRLAQLSERLPAEVTRRGCVGYATKDLIEQFLRQFAWSARDLPRARLRDPRRDLVALEFIAGDKISTVCFNLYRVLGPINHDERITTICVAVGETLIGRLH